MLSLAGAAALINAFKPDKSKKEALIQAQVLSLVELRREPCSHLFADLLRWVEDESTPPPQRVDRLRDIIRDAVPRISPLVSSETFEYLMGLLVTVNKPANDEASQRAVISEAHLALSFKKGQEEGRSRWGLLLLLRDDIGSNAPAASSILT